MQVVCHVSYVYLYAVYLINVYVTTVGYLYKMPEFQRVLWSVNSLHGKTANILYNRMLHLI